MLHKIRTDWKTQDISGSFTFKCYLFDLFVMKEESLDPTIL